MWVELENAEIDEIVDALGPSRLAEKLSGRPHHQTGAFAKAAEKKLSLYDTGLMIEPSGIIKRGDFGAWVMAWLWVTEKQADVPDCLCSTYLATEHRRLVEELPSFRALDIHRGVDRVVAHGEMQGFEWSFETIGSVWTLAAFPQAEKYADWFHIEEWSGDLPVFAISSEELCAAVVQSLHRMILSQTAYPIPRHPIFWRKYLDLYALDVISEEEAVKWLNVSGELLRQKARPIRTHVEAERKAGKKIVLAGPGIPRFDTDTVV